MPEALKINTKNPALSPTKSPAGDDATVIRLCDEILAGSAEAARLNDEGRAVGADWAAVKALVTAGRAARRQVAAMPAVTLAGWRAKASVLELLQGQDDALAWSLAQDILAASA